MSSVFHVSSNSLDATFLTGCLTTMLIVLSWMRGTIVKAWLVVFTEWVLGASPRMTAVGLGVSL